MLLYGLRYRCGQGMSSLNTVFITSDLRALHGVSVIVCHMARTVSPVFARVNEVDPSQDRQLFAALVLRSPTGHRETQCFDGRT